MFTWCTCWMVPRQEWYKHMWINDGFETTVKSLAIDNWSGFEALLCHPHLSVSSMFCWQTYKQFMKFDCIITSYLILIMNKKNWTRNIFQIYNVFTFVIGIQIMAILFNSIHWYYLYIFTFVYLKHIINFFMKKMFEV